MKIGLEKGLGENESTSDQRDEREFEKNKLLDSWEGDWWIE